MNRNVGQASSLPSERASASRMTSPPSASYVFSGVRPSSGAETLANDAHSEISDKLQHAESAALQSWKLFVSCD